MKEFALIGCGYWGTIILNTIKKLNKHKYIYIHDEDNKKVKILKKRFGKFVKEANLKKILNNKKIKYIYLATPPSKNYNLVKKIIYQNKNILIEKPGFRVISEFNKIKKILPKTKSKIRVGYVYLYNNYIKYIKRIILNKKFGKIKYIKFIRENFGPIRNDVNSFIDLATHDLSIIKYFFKNKLKTNKVIKHDILRKKNGDITFANFKCKNIDIDISVSWLHPEKIRKIIIISDKKMIIYDEMNLSMPIKIFNNYATYPKILKYSKSYFSKKAFIYKGTSKYIKLKTRQPLENEILSFINNEKNICDLNYSSEILKIAKKII